jgi:adenosylhomocysteine nucleosidase
MDTSTPKVAIIAALEREVRGLLREWRKVERTYEGRRFKVFESGGVVLVCGGIGYEAARRAAEAAVALYKPQVLLSAGFAGALDARLKVGQILWPRAVIDASDGRRTEAASGRGSLVSFSSVAGPGQKAKLAMSYGAQAVDMEAAAVARSARTKGIAFAAVKAVSDEASFEMPDVYRFVTNDGRVRFAAVVAFAVLRPWLWPALIRLGRNSAKASQALCGELERYLREAGRLATPALQTAARIELK